MLREPTEYVLVAGAVGVRATRLEPEHIDRWRAGELGIFLRQRGELLELMNAGDDEYSEWRPVSSHARQA